MNLQELKKIANENNYTDVHDRNGSFIAITPFTFTYGIIADITSTSYERRWCYPSYMDAKRAIELWINSDEQEPDHWIRRTHIKDPYPPGFDVKQGHKISDILYGRLKL